MIQRQQTIVLGEYIKLHELIVPKDNIFRRMNELVDFSLVYDELKDKYCHDNGRNAINPIRMFKYSILKAIYKLLDIDVVDTQDVICYLNIS